MVWFDDRIDGWWSKQFHPGFQETSLGQTPQKNPAKERSSTELRFRFVPVSIVCVRRSLSRVSDERPSGALDSPRRALWENCCYFSLDHADVVIEGILRQQAVAEPCVRG